MMQTYLYAPPIKSQLCGITILKHEYSKKCEISNHFNPPKASESNSGFDTQVTQFDSTQFLLDRVFPVQHHNVF